jgi:hypothetical protein
MTLFILYQTDRWKTKSSRVFYGVFDSRDKARDCANYFGLYVPKTKVIIEEITLNQFQDK